MQQTIQFVQVKQLSFAGGGDEYEFFVDNISVQAQSATTTFSMATLADNEVVKVVVTNNTTTCTASSEVTVTVLPLPTAGLTSSDVDHTICAGDNVTFTATGGTLYEFFVDAASQGAVVAVKSVRVEVRRVVTTEFLFVSTAAAAAAVAASLLLCADYLDKSEEHNPPPPLLLPLMKQQQ